jgi:hypothetical protein
VATAIEPPEDLPIPRRPWGARTNRALIGLLGVWTLWMIIKSLGAGLVAVPTAIAAFVIVMVGLLALEIVVLFPLRRYPSIAPWTANPVVALLIVVVAVAGIVVRELGVVTIDMQSAEFSTKYVSRARVDGRLQAMSFAFDCEIRCHGEDVCDAMGDTITAACSSTAPNHLVIDLWTEDPSCYTPLVKSFSTSFIAQVTLPTASRLRFATSTTALVVGVSSCRSARRKAGEVLAQNLLAAIAESLEKPETLWWQCADQSTQPSRCVDPWLTP